MIPLSPSILIRALAVLLFTAVSAIAQTPVPTDLGHLGGGSASVSAVASGYVGGYSTVAGGDRHAFVWSAATGMTDIGVLVSSPLSIATGVNSNGEVVGGYYAPDYSSVTAFYWSQSTGIVPIGLVGNVFEASVLINGSGVVAGVTSTGDLFRWTLAGGFENLGNNNGSNAVAVTGINAGGDIVGNGGFGTAFVFYAATGTVTTLTSPGDATPRGDIHMDPVSIKAAGISDTGAIVGTYWDFGYLINLYAISEGGFYNAYIHNSHAFAWTPGTGFTDLGNFGARPVPGSATLVRFGASANAINASGTIVGHSEPPAGGVAPFVYNAATGVMTQLPVPAGNFGSARGINDAGVIVGDGNGTAQALMWDNGVVTNLTPAFAPQFPGSPIIKASTIAGNGYDGGFNSHAWTLALPSVPACGGLFFVAPLSEPHPCVTIPAGKYGHTASGLQRTQSSSTTDRPMVATVLNTYLTASNFTAEVTVKLANIDLLYFGLGQGDMDPSYFNEPNHAFYFRVHSGWQGNYSIQADARSSSAFAVTQVGSYTLGSTITLRIVRAGDTVTMSVVGGGSVSYGISAFPSLGLTNSNTRVFFGNSTVGSVFSDLKIYESSPDTTAPVIDGPGGLVREATGPGGAEVTFTATAEDDVDGPVAVTASPASGSLFAIGDTTVELSATDAAGNSATASFTVTVEDTMPPVITSVSGDLTAEATSAAGAIVSYDAATATDTVGVVSIIYSHASGTTFPIGATTVTVTATDAAGNASAAQFVVTVHDTTAPAMGSVSPSQATLWPPNHQMVAIDVTAVATDAVGVTSLKIIGVASSEPDNGLGDGDTAGDSQITGDLTVNLRAERGGKGTGRTYTITVEARDAAGNASTTTCTVFVPKSKGK